MKLDRLERRAFIRMLGAAGASSAIARTSLGQQLGTPLVGVLSSSRADPALSAAFRQGLSEAGFAEGTGVAVDYRWADDQYDKLPALAAELVARKVWVIAAFGLVAALAAKSAARGIPIVFVVESDPIKSGLVSNLMQPGGNATGVSFRASELTATQFDLLQQLATDLAAIGLLVNPNNPTVARDLEAAGSAHAKKLIVVKAGRDEDLNAAFSSLVAQGARGLVVPRDPFFLDQPEKLVALTTQHKLPAIFPAREFAAAGGLMSYGASIAGPRTQVGIYTGFILKGTPVIQLPIQQDVNVEFVINLDTASALGFTVPVSLLSKADSVIQRR